jgi:Iap family predicted aminopeptidase
MLASAVRNPKFILFCESTASVRLRRDVREPIVIPASIVVEKQAKRKIFKITASMNHCFVDGLVNFADEAISVIGELPAGLLLLLLLLFHTKEERERYSLF